MVKKVKKGRRNSACWNTTTQLDPDRFSLSSWPGMTAKCLLKRTRSRTTHTHSPAVQRGRSCRCVTVWGKNKDESRKQHRNFLLIINTSALLGVSLRVITHTHTGGVKHYMFLSILTNKTHTAATNHANNNKTQEQLQAKGAESQGMETCCDISM